MNLGCNFLLLTLLLVWSCKSVDQVTPKDEKEKEQTTLDNSLLWEISGNSLVETSYLFGTIHIIKSEDFFLPQGTLTAVDNSEKLIFEIDMADMSDPMKLMPLLQKAFMKGDTTLKDLVTVEDYKLIESHFKEIGLPIMFLERIKPMFLTVFASGDFDPGGLERGDLKSYEMEFAKMAEDGKKNTGGLETVEFQISVFDQIPYISQAEMLVETIKNSDMEDDSFKQLIQLYKDQNVQGLFEMMQTEETIAEFEDALLNKRNINWIPIMKSEMMNQKTFFAVGAGHLGGPLGVINLLRKEGYKVTAIKG